MVLRGCWCNITVSNVHAPNEEKSDYSKDSFCEKLEQVFYNFPKYHMKTLLESLIQNWGERIFSNQQSRMRVYIMTVLTMVLEY